MDITSVQLKELRDITGISVMQCKRALEEADGDMEKAKIILQKKGGEIALKKSDRELGAGAIGCYVHSTHEVAAMVQLSCETDFVAKNEEFSALAREIAMQVAAQHPLAFGRHLDLLHVDAVERGGDEGADIERPRDEGAGLLVEVADVAFAIGMEAGGEQDVEGVAGGVHPHGGAGPAGVAEGPKGKGGAARAGVAGVDVPAEPALLGEGRGRLGTGHERERFRL